MSANETLHEIRMAHGRHAGRRCQVCWMLAELDRRNADARATAAEEAAKVAISEKNIAVADAAGWRENVRDITERLLAHQHSTLLARDKAARDLAAAVATTDEVARAHGDKLAALRPLLNDVRLRLGVFPHTPRLREVLAALDAVYAALGSQP